MANIPAVKGGAAGAKWILRYGDVLFRRVPPLTIASGVVGCYTRVCGCHSQYDDSPPRLFDKLHCALGSWKPHSAILSGKPLTGALRAGAQRLVASSAVRSARSRAISALV